MGTSREDDDRDRPDAPRAADDGTGTLRDALFTGGPGSQRDLVDFRFDASVVRVFPDMIRRSVPGYEDTVALSGLIAAEFLPEGGTCFDLGCSLGATLLAVAHCTEGRDLRLVGVDASADMISRAREELPGALPGRTLELRQGDIRDADLSGASVVILNWTLQFVPPDDRAALMRRIHDALTPGGALLIAEKVRSEDDDEDALLDRLQRAFKRANGYSELEIAGKRAALENVLIRDSLAEHETRLRDAGFDRILCWQRSLNFIALLAVKP